MGLQLLCCVLKKGFSKVGYDIHRSPAAQASPERMSLKKGCAVLCYSMVRKRKEWFDGIGNSCI